MNTVDGDGAMYAENYARYRAPPAGEALSDMPPSGEPATMVAPPPQAFVGRPRGVSGGASGMRGGGGGHDAMSVMGMEMVPENLVKSLQPVAAHAGRYVARRASRGPAVPRGEDQWNPSAEYSKSGGGAYDGGYAPPPPASTQAPSMAMAAKPMARQPQQAYQPPSKYRRTAEFDPFEDPRKNGGGRPVGGGVAGPRGRGAPGGLRGAPPASSHCSVTVNSYDLTTREGFGANGPTGGPRSAYAPPPQQQLTQLRPPPQRAGYAPYAPPSPNTPRTPQEMMLLRRRLMEQERARYSPAGYRTGPPASPATGGGGSAAPPPPPPATATMSSAAAAWARELDPYDNARRIRRELQPPGATVGGAPSGGSSGAGGGGAPHGGGGAPMTPQQVSAHMRMLRGAGMIASAPSGYENSPGSRIVTPAAALHGAQRGGGGEWGGGHPRRAARGGGGGGGGSVESSPMLAAPSAAQSQPLAATSTISWSSSLVYDDELDPMAMAAMSVKHAAAMGHRAARHHAPRGPGGTMAMTMPPERAFPPAVTAQLSMHEYEAMMMMEREFGAAPSPGAVAMPDPRQQRSAMANMNNGINIGSRPPSAGLMGRARGGAGVAPAPRAMVTPSSQSDGKIEFDPYAMPADSEYAMAPGVQGGGGGGNAAMPGHAPKPSRGSKAAREAAKQAPLPPPPPPSMPVAPPTTTTMTTTTTTGTVRKRKEPAASKRKARDNAEQMPPMNRAPSAKASKASAKAAAAAAGKEPATTIPTANNGSSCGGTSETAEPKRRCGRKSMNYSSEQKRERNRAAVKKCRQRQALKYEYLKRKAEVLASENRALSEMLLKNVELDDEKHNSLTRGIQMDILLKIKEIFTQSLPKDFVLDADSIWDLNSVLAVSMPSRCYYGIESIKDFWRTSLRMRNKGKIRSFWAWLFRLPPGDRFAEFAITPFSPTSNLYFVNWTTKSKPALSGSIVIMFGHGHRVTLHVEIFGWLIWRYLLTNTPFPEPSLE